ncbi:MAG: T9SS type A sorting domain-containing protein [Ekhidna sp.]
MTRYLVFLFLISATYSSAHSQNTSQQVIATAGDVSTSDGTQLSWTIGQTVASSSSNNSIFLNEGFQQSEVITIELGATPEAQHITIYPNPTVDYIQLQASQNRGSASYQLASLKGEILLEELEADFSKENKLNMIDFADGVYLLTIKTENQAIKQFKIIKN